MAEQGGAQGKMDGADPSSSLVAHPFYHSAPPYSEAANPNLPFKQTSLNGL